MSEYPARTSARGDHWRRGHRLSIAYHLTKLGCRDVILLERTQLTAGTTWHAAGLLTSLRDTETQTRLAKYSQDLYRKLESETGQLPV